MSYLGEIDWLARHGLITNYVDYQWGLPLGVLDDARLLMEVEAGPVKA